MRIPELRYTILPERCELWVLVHCSMLGTNSFLAFVCARLPAQVWECVALGCTCCRMA